MNRRNIVKKRIAKIICAVMCIAVLLMPVSVFAAEERSTLTLTYSKEGVIFSDVEIRIYRIAGEDLEKLPSYSAYPIEIGDLVTQAQKKKRHPLLRHISPRTVQLPMQCRSQLPRDTLRLRTLKQDFISCRE